jgi:hypothetical protein
MPLMAATIAGWRSAIHVSGQTMTKTHRRGAVVSLQQCRRGAFWPLPALPRYERRSAPAGSARLAHKLLYANIDLQLCRRPLYR